MAEKGECRDKSLRSEERTTSGRTDSGSDVVRMTYDRGTASVSDIVLSAVASASDVDPLELPPLFRTIDPDALDALFDSTPSRSTAGSESDLYLEFEYAGYRVAVSQGVVVVRGPKAL